MRSMRYKEITLPKDAGFTRAELRAISTFNAAFPDEGVKLRRAEQELKIHLHRVDIAHLRATVRELAKNGGNGMFTDVLRSVENIKSYGLAGGKRQYVDYNKERKVANRKDKEAGRAPYFYAQNHPFKEENTDIPPAYADAIICGDSEAVLKKLPDNCVDIVFTSPPYNFGLDYHGDDDTRHWQDYFDKLHAVLRQCIRVLKYGGRLVINVQPLYSDYIPSHHMITNFLMQEKLIWKGEILWEKNNYNCKYTAWGSWKSPSNPYLKYTWEFVEVFCKGSLKKPGASADADISADDFKKWTTGKWSIAPERNMKKYGHPAMFPEGLAARVLQLFSYKGDLVLDPFNGVGTTTAVAKRLGRRHLGIDVDSAYCKTAKKRVQAEAKKMGLFTNA